jgi:hypothetical protein
VMLGRSKMDELLVDRRIPMGATVEGRTDDGQTGWAARFTPYDGPPNAGPGQTILERVELEIWWLTADGSRHTFPLEAYRRAVIPVPGI